LIILSSNLLFKSLTLFYPLKYKIDYRENKQYLAERGQIMCKKMQEIWDKIRKWLPTVLISFGALSTLYGISEKSSFCILLGTFFLGWGFYLKVNRVPEQKLSDYGHFMLGLATLITLPQAPEMLRNILKIGDY
jgi:hypothetical protein